MTVIGTDHKCDPQDIQTATLLKQNTKPCPKCHVLIYKIDGCDQMRCTQCHVAFSWIRGTIETRIHNPHYFEWMHQMAKTNNPITTIDPQNINCNEFDQTIVVQNLTIMSQNIHDENLLDGIRTLLSLCRNITHLDVVQKPKLQESPEKTREKLLDFRCKFLTNESTEKVFKSKLLQHFKHTEKTQDVLDILDLYIQSSQDYLVMAANLNVKDKDFSHSRLSIVADTRTLNEWANNILAQHKVTYNCVGFQLLYNETQPKTNNVLIRVK